jgi:hypothetical protein
MTGAHNEHHGRNAWPDQGRGTARNNGQLFCEVATDFDSSKKIDHIDTMGGICL